MNEFFDSGDYTPPTAHTSGRSATLASLAQALENAFDLFPTAAALNQDRLTYAVDTGTANAYAVALPVTLLAYAVGIRITMKALNANTGASTVNVDSIGVKGIKRPDGTDLEANDIAAGGLAVLGYDGTNFQLLNSSAANADIAAHAALTATHGAAGAIVGTTNTQTLTNKSLTSPILNGTVQLPGASNFISSTGQIGIGMTPTRVIDITQTQNAESAARITNASAGTGASVGWTLSNGTNTTDLAHFGTAFTTAGIYRQNGTLLQGSGLGGITLHSDNGAGFIDFAINDVDVARFTPANNGTLLIGTTSDSGTRKLVVNHGTASAETAYFSNDDPTITTAQITTLDFSGDTPDDNTAVFLRAKDATATRLVIYSDGDVQNHDNSYGAISARELKRDIVDARTQSADIMAMRLVNFRFKTDVTAGKNKEMLGLVADEVEAISPGLVTTDAEGVKGIRYSILYMKAVGALQETIGALQEALAEIAELKTRVTALETK